MTCVDGEKMTQNEHECNECVRTELRPRVLVAEDDDAMRHLLSKVLYADGYAAVECRDGIDLFGRLEAFVGRRATLDFDAIISDIVMPGLTGLDILEALHSRNGFPPMILITAFGDKGIHGRARKAGAAAVLDKPFGFDELLAKLHEIVPHQPHGHEEVRGD
jgi:two-component system, response regulator, stage 0 sporulation protein F